jgi:hypothetical protein
MIEITQGEVPASRYIVCLTVREIYCGRGAKKADGGSQAYRPENTPDGRIETGVREWSKDEPDSRRPFQNGGPRRYTVFAFMAAKVAGLIGPTNGEAGAEDEDCSIATGTAGPSVCRPVERT